MTSLVSIRPDGEISYLRRYQTGALGRPAKCTHAGTYDTAGVIPHLIEYYRLAGSEQDRVELRRRGDPQRATSLPA